MIKKIISRSGGFSLVEVLIGVAIFVFLMLGVYGISVSIIRGVAFSREEITISALADQYLEIARNLPYSKVGTLNGNPHGSLPDLPNAVGVELNGNSYQIYYAVSYVDDPSDGTILAGTDPAPNDYKQIKLYVKNAATNSTNSFLTNIVPKGLEGLDSGGALAIKIFDAVGQPVPGATIQIKNSNIVPAINLTRTSDEQGDWIEVGLPNSDNDYHIVVTKNGYSSDQTYPSSESNPNPTKPDATIANGQVTQVSFSIDLLSNLTLNTLNQTCGAIPGMELALRGSKIIGTSNVKDVPPVLKFYNICTSNSEGQISLNDIEWDNYTPAPADTSYMIYGSSPVQQIDLLPNTSQIATIILGPSADNSLLVIVKDASTGSPIEGVNVDLQLVSSGEVVSKITGGSVWSQSDWQGGAGQENFTDPAKYFEDSGTISNDVIPLGLRLAKFGDSYASSGSLTSSTFDTGTSLTSYTTLTWQPTSQNPSTSIKFQIAASNDAATSTWNFIGPDGTDSTYYTTPGTTISPTNSNNRYVRYRVLLQTDDPYQTPVLSSVNINYVSGCFTPGQAMFPGLANGIYNLTASAGGYQTQTIEGLEINEGGYNVFRVLLNR
jgi:hypothetical protein